MKLVRYDGGNTGLLVDAGGDAVVDVRPALQEVLGWDGASWNPLIERWPEVSARLRELERAGGHTDARPLSDVRLEPPLPHPASRVFAMGGNFPAHSARMATQVQTKPEASAPARPALPWGFYVIPGTIVGPDSDVTPPVGTQKLDYEAEVALVLGRSVGSGELHVWGYTCWNDFSIRDAALGLAILDHGPLTWSLQKNFTSGNSCGPYLVVVDGGLPSEGIPIACRVNGELRQEGNTTDMRHGFEEIAVYVSQYVPLGAGDVILSGTPPGTAMESGEEGRFLTDGDVTEVEVGGAGVLRNRIVAG
jgi:2-keto-4-pentenoate hydratase/2-oxohepta-3-ene-1,7-dioic acid hydratase in catechol pathway